MVTVYDAECDGKTRRLVFLKNWDRHQRISHPKKPRFPRPSNDSVDSAEPVAENFGKLRKFSENCSQEEGKRGRREEGNSFSSSRTRMREDGRLPSGSGDAKEGKRKNDGSDPGGGRFAMRDGWAPSRGVVDGIVADTGGSVDVRAALRGFVAYHLADGGVRSQAQWDGLLRGWCSNAAERGRYEPAHVALPSDAWIESHLTRRLPDGADLVSARRRLFDLVRAGVDASAAADEIIGGVLSAGSDAREHPL